MSGLAAAARAMLDAFGGMYPDWLLPEADQLARELAAVEAEELGPHVAAIEHMRCAEAFARTIGNPRMFKRVREAVEAVERDAGRLTLPHAAEVEREGQRLALLPDPAPKGAK